VRGWTLLVLSTLAACDTPAIRQTGFGTATMGGGSTPTGSQQSGQGFVCDRANDLGWCNVYTGTGWDAQSAGVDCGMAVVTGLQCPSDGQVGLCVTGGGSTQERWQYYYVTAQQDAGYLEDQCVALGGNWLASGST
jgi:hypothetical protein